MCDLKSFPISEKPGTHKILEEYLSSSAFHIKQGIVDVLMINPDNIKPLVGFLRKNSDYFLNQDLRQKIEEILSIINQFKGLKKKRFTSEEDYNKEFNSLIHELTTKLFELVGFIKTNGADQEILQKLSDCIKSQQKLEELKVRLEEIKNS